VHKFFRFTTRLLSLAVIFLLAGCADLALPPDEINAPAPTPDNTVVVLNIAPTPTAQAIPVATIEPIASPTPLPSPTPTLFAAAISVADPNCAETFGQLKADSFVSTVIGAKVPVKVYLPPCYDHEDNLQQYPVLYLFHGSPFDERHWISVGMIDAVNNLIGSGDLPPFIIVLPRGDLNGTFGHSSGGDNSWEGVVVNELIPYIDKNYRTLATRHYRAIGGISRGGVWSLEIGLRHPDLFASIGGHSPALSVNLATGDYNPFNIVRNYPIDSLRIYLDAGDNDWTRFETGDLSKALDDLHLPHTFGISPGEHIDSYWASQVYAYLRFYAAPWKAERVAALQAQSSPTP
jgi:enterochelin esterase-like enzyme